jgi:sulfotransferase
MDSIDRLIRRNAFELSGIFGYESSNTVYTRVNRLAVSDGLVGFAIDALREAFWGENADRLILVGYGAMAKKPEGTLQLLYNFLGEPWFEHDFDNVEYEADEFDPALDTPNLHTVRRKVEWIDRTGVLPPELFARFVNDAFWTVSELNTHNVPVILYRDYYSDAFAPCALLTNSWVEPLTTGRVSAIFNRSTANGRSGIAQSLELFHSLYRRQLLQIFVFHL